MKTKIKLYSEQYNGTLLIGHYGLLESPTFIVSKLDNISIKHFFLFEKKHKYTNSIIDFTGTKYNYHLLQFNKEKKCVGSTIIKDSNDKSYSIISSAEFNLLLRIDTDNLERFTEFKFLKK